MDEESRRERTLPRASSIFPQNLFFLFMLVAVSEEMEMAVRMKKVFMAVDVVMDQVHPQEQVQVFKNLLRGSAGRKGMAFLHDECPIGNFFQDGKVVGGRNDGFADGVQFAQNFHQPDLGPGI